MVIAPGPAAAPYDSSQRGSRIWRPVTPGGSPMTSLAVTTVAAARAA